MRSAGIVVFRRPPISNPATDGAAAEVLIGHLGGPFWAKKDDGAWSFPKGLIEADEDPLAAAQREFREELGFAVPDVSDDSAFVDLGTSSASRKEVRLFAVEADPDVLPFRPGLFEMEWPPRSGRSASFPEIDRIAWVGLDAAAAKLSAAQRPFVERLRALVSNTTGSVE